jgi:DNA processing protein
LHTVQAALERDVTVMAVPGPVRGPASAGTNALLVAGAAPVRDAVDVLVALGLDSVANNRGLPEPDPEHSLDELEARVLAALQHAPATVEQLSQRLGREARVIALQLFHLEARGLVVAGGGWWEVTQTGPGPWAAGGGSVP